MSPATTNKGQLPMVFGDADAVARRFEAAERIFSCYLRTARRAGAKWETAMPIAIDRARQATGIDWGEELGLVSRPKVSPARPGSSSTLDFLDAWRSGSLAIPWAPTLTLDAHAAFLTWCDSNGRAEASMKSFALAIVASGGMRRHRASWSEGNSIHNPAAFLVPNAMRPKRGQTVCDWLGEAVAAFRSASKAIPAQ